MKPASVRNSTMVRASEANGMEAARKAMVPRMGSVADLATSAGKGAQAERERSAMQ